MSLAVQPVIAKPAADLQANVPIRLQNLKRWLVWKYLQKPGEAKPRKVPYYTNGSIRRGAAGAPSDLVQLDSFANALAAYSTGNWSGIGLALIDGDNVGAIDIDGCINNGALTGGSRVARVLSAARNAGCYIERSPSGQGIRVLGATQGFQTIKSPIEAYCQKQFVTVTGDASKGGNTWGSIDDAVAQITSPQPANNNAKPSQQVSASNLNANIQSGLNQTLQETEDNIARVNGALACLEPDAPYPDWRDIVFAVHSTGWACAEDLARAWSAGGDPLAPAAAKYNPSEFDKLWASAKPDGGITLGTLIWRARQAGWTNHIPAMGPLWLLEMNSKYAWMDKEAGIYRIEYGDFIDTRQLKKQYKNRTENCGTAEKPRLVDIATLWEAHPNRREHKRLVLAPGQGEIVGQNELNTWQGFAIDAARGDVRPFLKLLMRLVPDRGERRYLLLWMAHLIQRPGVKMNAAVVIWSPFQGVGKNLIAECLTGIIGSKHSTIIGSSELASRFNGWARDKVFVLGDEVSGSDKRENADKLKGYITGTTIQIDEKNQPVRETENLMNLMFLSNHADAVFMQENDRRFFVVESPAAPLAPAKAEAFVQWRDNGGLGHLRAFLERVPLHMFKPKAPPPKTAAHSQMIFSNKSDFEQWAHDLMANGGRAVGAELTTSALLGRLYNQQTGKPEPSAKTVNNAFQKLGAENIGQVIDPSGSNRRTIALKRPGYWRAASPADRQAELAKGAGARL